LTLLYFLKSIHINEIGFVGMQKRDVLVRKNIDKIYIKNSRKQ